MKVLVLGANGMLGSEIVRSFRRFFEVIAFGSKEADITDQTSIQKMINEVKSEIVINAAAYTDVDGCEKNKDHAIKVNALGVKNIAEACKEAGSKIVHISTDYVFNGTSKKPYKEDDETNPINFYGESKLRGENYIKEVFENFLIIRSEWLYGAGGKNFINLVIEKAKNAGKLKVVNDQIGAPTYTKDLSEAILALLKKDCRGIYNAANKGHCSWFEVACKVVELLKLKVSVEPIPTAESNRIAKRPGYSVLDCNKLKRDTGFVFRPWNEALKDFLGLI